MICSRHVVIAMHRQRLLQLFSGVTHTLHNFYNNNNTCLQRNVAMSRAVYKHCVQISIHSLISTTTYHKSEKTSEENLPILKKFGLCHVVIWHKKKRKLMAFNWNKQLSSKHSSRGKRPLKWCVCLSFSLLPNSRFISISSDTCFGL